MDTVNAFKKLLDIDLENLKLNPRDFGNLTSVNKQSEKLNNLLESNVLNQQVGDSAKRTFGNGIVPTNEKVDLFKHKKIESINSGNVDDGGGQNEKMPDFKLRKSELTIPKSSMEKSNQKASFLKKGEGLKRFNIGNVKRIGFVEDLPAKSINFDNKKNGTETISAKQSTHSEDNGQPNTLTCKSKKIISISKKCSDPIPQIQRETKHHKSNGIQKKPEDSNLLLKDVFRKEKNQRVTNFERISHESEESNCDDHSLLLVKHIGQLEKRLLDLIHLKSTLTQDESEPDNEDELDEKLISSQLVEILNEILKLNDKISPLSESKQSSLEEETTKQSNNCLNIDTKSRDFWPPDNNANSMSSILSNGDKIKLSKDHSLTYTHLNGISQTIYQDGSKVVLFPNGQIEKTHANGSKQITYSNGQQRIINPDYSEKLQDNDGRVCTFYADGTEKIEYPNGDMEYKTHEYTKRHFANGDIKTVYENGCQETIYCNGRIRMKDQFGNVVFDRTP